MYKTFDDYLFFKYIDDLFIITLSSESSHAAVQLISLDYIYN